MQQQQQLPGWVSNWPTRQLKTRDEHSAAVDAGKRPKRGLGGTKSKKASRKRPCGENDGRLSTCRFLRAASIAGGETRRVSNTGRTIIGAKPDLLLRGVFEKRRMSNRRSFHDSNGERRKQSKAEYLRARLGFENFKIRKT